MTLSLAYIIKVVAPSKVPKVLSSGHKTGLKQANIRSKLGVSAQLPWNGWRIHRCKGRSRVDASLGLASRADPTLSSEF